MLLAKWLRFVVLLADDYLTRLRGWFFFDTEWWRTHQEWVHELEIQNNRNGGDQNIQSTADWRGTRVRVTSNGIKWRLFWWFPCFEPPYRNQISIKIVPNQVFMWIDDEADLTSLIHLDPLSISTDVWPMARLWKLQAWWTLSPCPFQGRTKDGRVAWLAGWIWMGPPLTWCERWSKKTPWILYIVIKSYIYHKP